MTQTKPATTALAAHVKAATSPRVLNEDACWQASIDKRASADGMFYVAVRTTKIYCRPSCPSRQPLRRNVSFFTTADAAEAAGYRACKRCKPRDPVRSDVALVQRMCRRLEAASDRSPTLAELSSEFGLSQFHLQRTFKRATGVSPRRYFEARRTERLKRGLRNGDGVAAAVYGAGFGSSSRAYEDAGRLGMTPGSYGRGGEGMSIGFTTATCEFGRILVAATQRGVCSVAFGEHDRGMEERLNAEYPAADIARDDATIRPWLDAVLRTVTSGEPQPHLPLDIRATAFRTRVWDALCRIPRGETRTYGDIAREIGEPQAARAVGNACRENPVALVIPCHRVVRNDGSLGGYYYGADRKKKILEKERRAERA